MALLRYFLILTSVGVAGFLGYILATEQVHVPWTVSGFIAACVLNAIYLVAAGHPIKDARRFRFFRLFSLWLDAKEAELKVRAKK